MGEGKKVLRLTGYHKWLYQQALGSKDGLVELLKSEVLTRNVQAIDLMDYAKNDHGRPFEREDFEIAAMVVMSLVEKDASERTNLKELGVRDQELGVSGQELGVRDQESGGSGQELGVRGQIEVEFKTDELPSSERLRRRLMERLSKADHRCDLIEENAMEMASYAGYCKDPAAVEALEERAYVAAMDTFIDEAQRGLYRNEGIWSEKQVKEAIEELGVRGQELGGRDQMKLEGGGDV